MKFIRIINWLLHIWNYFSQESHCWTNWISSHDKSIAAQMKFIVMIKSLLQKLISFYDNHIVTKMTCLHMINSLIHKGISSHLKIITMEIKFFSHDKIIAVHMESLLKVKWLLHKWNLFSWQTHCCINDITFQAKFIAAKMKFLCIINLLLWKWSFFSG